MIPGPTGAGIPSRKTRGARHFSEPAILPTDFDPLNDLRTNAPNSLRQSKKYVTDVLRKSLAEANRDFARLLRDLRSQSSVALPSDPRGRDMGALLIRAVRCAAKQYVLRAELGSLALTDELTGLYNRRGFVFLAERQWKLAFRARRGLLLFFIDVDGLKAINDSFGHSEGDCALRRAAKALQSTFRDSDVIARVGGDEFAVLATERARHGAAAIRTRLAKCINLMNSEESRYSLSISLGVARLQPRTRMSMATLLVQADRKMYQQKRLRAAMQTHAPQGRRNQCQ
jgi:diguanylate cyclase (GGDEF)-like protein